MTGAGRFAAVAIMIGSTSMAMAQPRVCGPAAFETFYDCLRDSTVETLKVEIAEIEAAARTATELAATRARRLARSSEVPVRAPSLATANAATAAELAQAAISTSVNGAEAGISVSPLALMGYPDSKVQVPLTLAALKDGITRLQVGLTVQLNDDPVVVVKGCPVDENALRVSIEHERASYAQACQGVAALQPTAPLGTEQAAGERAILAQMRRACGLDLGPADTGAPPKKVSTGADWITDGVKNLRKIYSGLSRSDRTMPASLRVLERLFPHGVDELSAYKEILPDECDNQSSQAISDAAVRAVWNTPRVRLGFSARSDRFQHQRGFNPDHSTPLEDGRRKDGELRIEASYTRRRFELVAGVGAGRSRLAFADARVGYFSPSLSIACTVASLSHDHLYKDGELQLVDGALPPRLVLGIETQLQYAPSPPAIQVVKIQRVGVTAFADFRFTEKLAVRIGIPLAADLLARKNKDGMEVKLDRQWSFPAFVATVLKL